MFKWRSDNVPVVDAAQHFHPLIEQLHGVATDPESCLRDNPLSSDGIERKLNLRGIGLAPIHHVFEQRHMRGEQQRQVLDVDISRLWSSSYSLLQADYRPPRMSRPTLAEIVSDLGQISVWLCRYLSRSWWRLSQSLPRPFPSAFWQIRVG